jgi:chaperonin cofactor prefoldin
MGLTIQVKRSSTRQQLDKELERLSSKKKKLNLRKNMGKVRFQDIEPLELQKKLRDEWE